MATFKPYYGLQKIEGAAAVQNNTDPTPLTIIPFTKVQTAVYGNDANTTASQLVEEQLAPIAILESDQGAFTFKWTTFCNDLSVLALLEGGTYTAQTGGTGAQYTPPKTPISVYLYLKFTNLQGGGVKFFNAKVDVQRTGNFQRGALPELAVTATAMAVPDPYFPIIEFQPVVS